MRCIELLNPSFGTMGIKKFLLLLLFISIATDVWSHHHHGHYSEHKKEDNRADVVDEASSFGKITDTVRSELSKKNDKYPDITDSKAPVPSARKLEKMLEKAILQIITGDLSKADMLLLKSLNYSLEEVLMIRERELGKRKNEESREEPKFFDERKSHDGELYGKKEKHRNRNYMELDSLPRDFSDIQESRNTKRRNRYKEKASYEKDFDFEAHNRQAISDYENLSSMLETRQSWPTVLDSSSRDISEIQELRNGKKNRYKKKSSSYKKDLDLEAYNRQATIDYENFASKYEPQQSAEFINSDYEDESRNFDRSLDRAVKPHIVFKISYDNSEFDSNLDTKKKSNRESIGRDDVTSKNLEQSTSSTLKNIVAKNVGNLDRSPWLFSFSSSSSSSSPATTTTITAAAAASAPLLASTPPSIVAYTPLPPVYQLGTFKTPRTDNSSTTKSPESNSTPITNITSTANSVMLVDMNNSTNDENLFDKETIKNEHSEYEGLIWIADDVYRAKEEYPLSHENIEENQSISDYEDENLSTLLWKNDNDTYEYQNETPDPPKPFIDSVNGSIENASMTNQSTYQQLRVKQRQEENVTSSSDSQSLRMIEDIKSKILALTGRSNVSTNTNQVQREKLIMFSPTCQMPRNTDSEAWADPFSMNMHFQLNLTSDYHIVAARLRIYRLPQENLTTPTSEIFDEVEDDEKKIRISVYYYTKALKKHRAKKRLMDSIVTPLTPDGMHLALNVRYGLKFWRLSSRNSHGSNHGLVIQIEDQDGRPLKPALYIQQSSCVDPEPDSKAYQRIPALFIRACARYIRVVEGKKVTYVVCRH